VDEAAVKEGADPASVPDGEAPRSEVVALVAAWAAAGVAARLVDAWRPWVALASGVAFFLVWLGWRVPSARRAAQACAVASVAWFFMLRLPWNPMAGAVVWSGAVAFSERPSPSGFASWTAFVVGFVFAAAAALVSVVLAGASWPAVLVLVVAGRLAAVSLASEIGATAVVFWSLGFAVPAALGPWGLVAASVEASAAACLGFWGSSRARWSWAAGGVGALAGALAGLWTIS
jgi:hypothetical protein